MNYYTIGMAGHIDHGKTTLTKALTGVETDRLKEEQTRKISIEPGYALLTKDETRQISVIDVPGHERFIRQMIAGVAGIDLVVLVVAADEGVMPQTKEHLQILSALGMKHGFIVLTKTGLVDEELLQMVKADVIEEVKNSFLAHEPIYAVDSISGYGVENFRKALLEKIQTIETKRTDRPFRLPIDQVFTLQGQGVIVRGTVFDGQISKNEDVEVLPTHKKARIRLIQSEREEVESVQAGQRAALNLSGVSHEEIKRGDVLVSSEFYTVTRRIDLVLHLMEDVEHDIKQRLPIKLYANTAEVYGKIIFFDRNRLSKNEKDAIYCQVELEEEVVVKKGDPLIIRRATPMETIGGAIVIDAEAEKHRFGEETIIALQKKEAGSVPEIFAESDCQTKGELLKRLDLDEGAFVELESELLFIGKGLYTLPEIVIGVKDKIIESINRYHDVYSLRSGMNQAELFSRLSDEHSEHVTHYCLQDLINEGRVTVTGAIVALSNFKPHAPKKWQEAVEKVENELSLSGANPRKWEEIVHDAKLPENLAHDLYQLLITTERAYVFDEGRLVDAKTVLNLQEKLFQETKGEAFTLQDARESFELSRKNLVPLLELFDTLGYTSRDGNERQWLIN